jgi:hypothetical protein
MIKGSASKGKPRGRMNPMDIKVTLNPNPLACTEGLSTYNITSIREPTVKCSALARLG